MKRGRGMTEENIKIFKDMDEIHEKARVVITKEFNEMLEKAYMCGFEDGKKSIETEGEWETGYGFHDGAYWKCTNCSELIKVKIPMHYCNNCGAKMIGKYPYGSDKYKGLEE